MAEMVARLTDLRPRRRGNIFPLVAFTDVVFLLLVFLMLTAGGPKYGFLSLGRGASVAPDAAEASLEGVVVWHIGAGNVRIEKTEVALTDLGPAINTLRGRKPREIVLYAVEGARVRDIAAVLTALTAAGVAPVRLITLPPEGG